MGNQNRIEQLMSEVLRVGAVDIRDVDGGEEPFKYASGNWGPGYVMIKGLVARKDILKPLVEELAVKVAKVHPEIDFVAGNVSGGVVPGWILSEMLEQILGKPVPFVYVRDTRKKGGQKELITGANYIPKGSLGLVVEELVNFAQTTVSSAEALRAAGFLVFKGVCILFYDNPESLKTLQQHKMEEMIHLFTLPQLLNLAERNAAFPDKAIKSYRDYLRDPLAWQATRGLVPDPEGGTK